MKTNLDKLSSEVVVHNSRPLDQDINRAIEMLRETGAKNLKGYCNICEEQTEFRFIGTQRNILHDGVRLYNCSECHGTYSENTLRRRR